MARKIIPKGTVLVLPFCLLLFSCIKRELNIKAKSHNGLQVVHSVAPKKAERCDEAALIDTTKFKQMPLFEESIVIDRGYGGGFDIDYSDTIFRCDSWNINDVSNIYRTFFALPDLSALPECAQIKKANLWLHSDIEPPYYLDNPTDSIQILLTVWPRDSVDKIKWVYFPVPYTNTLSSSKNPYRHDTWMCFDLTAIVQNIIKKKYKNDLFMMRTSSENMFKTFSSRQKSFIGPKNNKRSHRPYLEIIF